MSAPLSWSWLLLLLAGTLIALAGFALTAWALLWDRARGRRRYPGRGCWYDMAGIPGLRCPECGREQRRERRFHRTRRRWRWAAAGCALVAFGLGTTVGFGQTLDSALGFVPARVWVTVLPLFDDQGKKAYNGARVGPFAGLPIVSGLFVTSTARSPAPAATRWKRLLIARQTALHGIAGEDAHVARDDAAMVAILTLLRAIDLPDEQSRLNACRTLARSFADWPLRNSPNGLVGTASALAEPAVPRLMRAARSDPSGRVRGAALRALFWNDAGPRHVPVFAGALLDEDPEVRSTASDALRWLRADARGAAPAMVKALADPDPKVRSDVCMTLASIGEFPEATPALAARLVTEPDEGLRKLAMAALVAVSGHAPEMVTALARALTLDESEPIRRSAAVFLRDLGPHAAAAEPALRRALQDPAPSVRDAAAEALQAIDQ